jgi:folate-binding protein YgfZ
MPYEERSEPTGLAIKRLIMAMQSNEIMRMAMGEALKRVREKHGRKRKRASTTHEQLSQPLMQADAVQERGSDDRRDPDPQRASGAPDAVNPAPAPRQPQTVPQPNPPTRLMPNDIHTAPAEGTWNCDAAAVERATAQPALAVLEEFGVIAATGADAASFLHAQLTNDVANLAPDAVQLNGYCNAKGRLLAVFTNWRSADTIYLQMPREILPAVRKRLSMFVLRAKVTLAEGSDQWTALGLLGPGTARLLQDAFALAQPIDTSVAVGQARIVRLRPSPRIDERFLLLVPAPELAEWLSRLRSVQRVDSGVWWWSQIDAGVPDVFAATQEKFVPQMINLEVLGGVSFKKGCYPGQEVVARSQYLGKLRRRMGIAHVEGAAAAGADVYADGEAQPVGAVVMAATAPGGGMDLLFECPVDRVGAGSLRAGRPDGPVLQVRPLPYQLFDPTA